MGVTSTWRLKRESTSSKARLAMQDQSVVELSERALSSAAAYGELRTKLRILLQRLENLSPAPMRVASQELPVSVVTIAHDELQSSIPKHAPKTVNNFVFLAGEGYYDGITFTA